MFKNKKLKLSSYFIQAGHHIEDVIGFEMFDKDYGKIACITWGRILKDSQLIDIIKTHVMQFGCTNIEVLKKCTSLQEIKQYPFFYECWVYFAHQEIFYKNNFPKMMKIKKKKILIGKDIKFMMKNSTYADNTFKVSK